MRISTLILTFLFVHIAQGQSNPEIFWNELKKHCGKAYQGTVADTVGNGAFTGKSIIMHFRLCNDSTIRIPLMVGEDRSRTWVLTFRNDRILLKHDHRHADGSPDSLTMYGGMSVNSGTKEMQFFPADEETVRMLPAGAGNIWWMTIDRRTFTYNLRRVNHSRLFTIEFDLVNAVDTPPAPWGSAD